MKKIYEGGQYTLVLNCYIDLTPEQNNVAFLIKDPDGNITQVPVTIVNPPTAGQLSYTFPQGFLKPGDYRIQSLLITQNLPGETYTMHVFQKFY